MKKITLFFFALAMAISANARMDIDFSAHYTEGTHVIESDAWGWKSVIINTMDVSEADYLYIKYNASMPFNLILQDPDWHNCYQISCPAEGPEAFIALERGAFANYSCVVIQPHAAGSISIDAIYFCTEQEFFYPDPQDREGARANLMDQYARYDKLTGAFEVGDDYNQYPADLYAAFIEALDAAQILDDGSRNYGNDLSVEELNAMSHAIVDAYRALAAARRLYSPADGYYRLICAREYYTTDEEGAVTGTYTKALYSKPSGENGWKNVDRQDPAFLWTLERQPNNDYLLRNPANGLIFSSPEKCSSDTRLITIDPISKHDGEYSTSWQISTDEDVVLFNFRMNNEAPNDYRYVHANWHNNGLGWEGPMTVWCNTAHDSGASEWYLEPVEDVTAEQLLNSKAFIQDFFTMIDDAKEKVRRADDKFMEQLITEPTQFSSPFSQNDFGQIDGGNLDEGVLIDDNPDTFWHSVWTDGNAPNGSHYLQIELPDEISGEIEFDFTRRSGLDSDHVTVWGVYGSSYGDGDKESYTLLSTLDTPYGQAGEHISAFFTIPEEEPVQYLRFYCEASTSNRGYFHVSEFQLYKLTENPNNQAAQLGERYDNLVAAIEKAAAVDPDAVTYDDYLALKTAYDAFMEKFVDKVNLLPAETNASHNLYAVDGRLIRQAATPGDLRSLSRGIYIFNGAKFVVK